MEIGKFYYSNQKRFVNTSESEWKVALAKGKDYIKWKLKQKTLFGAHLSSNLGSDPVDHYLGIAYEKLISGEWEWKNELTLSEQLMRIIGSYISKEVEKTKTNKTAAFSLEYRDMEQDFYSLVDSQGDDEEYLIKIKAIQEAIKGDNELEFMWEAIKEGKKRVEIAELLEIKPKQLDKLREKLILRARNMQTQLN